ncbi:MAG: hypothetical protein HKN23_04845 [Verrucomicrobiales bacterium]|nr:hypothetical protein [Verrucomicrobiales bacterium]
MKSLNKTSSALLAILFIASALYVLPYLYFRTTQVEAEAGLLAGPKVVFLVPPRWSLDYDFNTWFMPLQRIDRAITGDSVRFLDLKSPKIVPSFLP